MNEFLSALGIGMASLALGYGLTALCERWRELMRFAPGRQVPRHAGASTAESSFYAASPAGHVEDEKGVRVLTRREEHRLIRRTGVYPIWARRGCTYACLSASARAFTGHAGQQVAYHCRVLHAEPPEAPCELHCAALLHSN